PPPDLRVTAVGLPATALADHPLTVTYTVANRGATETPNGFWTDRVYLSTDPTLSADDLLLADQTHFGTLPPDQEYQATATGKLPPTLSGPLFAIVVTDASDQVFELDNTNNTAASAAPVQVDFRPPDLKVTSFLAPPAGVAGS